MASARPVSLVVAPAISPAAPYWPCNASPLPCPCAFTSDVVGGRWGSDARTAIVEGGHHVGLLGTVGGAAAAWRSVSCDCPNVWRAGDDVSPLVVDAGVSVEADEGEVADEATCDDVFMFCVDLWWGSAEAA